MLTIRYHSRFKKDFKKAKSRGVDIAKIRTAIELLANEQELPKEYKAHSLKGNYKGYMECHIEPDLLLVYKIDGGEMELLLFRTGTHSDLFKK